MENKYQEALDEIVKTYEDLAINKLHETGWHIDDMKAYWTLQELIDTYEEYMSYKKTMLDWQHKVDLLEAEQIQTNIRHIEEKLKLEKALDKACGYLKFDERREVVKEWLLKDEQ